MPRTVHFRDIGVRLVPAGDVVRHELWLNAQPPLTPMSGRQWPGYEAWQGDVRVGVVARREIDYPFCAHTYRDNNQDIRQPNNWLLLGADLHLRRYATSLRAAAERLVATAPSPPVHSAEDALALEGL